MINIHNKNRFELFLMIYTLIGCGTVLGIRTSSSRTTSSMQPVKNGAPLNSILNVDVAPPAQWR